MPGFDHQPGPASPDEPESKRNSRYGLILFAIYVLLYGGFMWANAFAPWLMEITIGGINLAVISGLGLIIAAFVLALVYAWLCRTPERSSSNATEGER